MSLRSSVCFHRFSAHLGLLMSESVLALLLIYILSAAKEWWRDEGCTGGGGRRRVWAEWSGRKGERERGEMDGGTFPTARSLITCCNMMSSSLSARIYMVPGCGTYSMWLTTAQQQYTSTSDWLLYSTCQTQGPQAESRPPSVVFVALRILRCVQLPYNKVHAASESLMTTD